MTVPAASVFVGLILGIVLSIEVGRRAGVWHWAGVPADSRKPSPTLEASIFGLMGLLIAFVFYGAGIRFENRRNLMVQEANAIGTAYLRLDLLPPDKQSDLRADFREYVRLRLEVFQNVPNPQALNAALAQSSTQQRNIWNKAVTATRNTGPATEALVLSSLNEVIDITTAQTVALRTHPPFEILVMLSVTVLASSALAGYEMAAIGVHDWLFVIAYALILGGAVYMILDYEFPRVGLIRIDPVDQVLMNTLMQMK